MVGELARAGESAGRVPVGAGDYHRGVRVDQVREDGRDQDHVQELWP